MNKIKTAVITGHHPYDVPNFQMLFRGLPEIDCYPQHLEEFVSDTSGIRQQFYDVLVFYNFHQETPSDEGNWWEQGMRAALEQLGETKQGIFLLHHAILAFPEWKLWADISGISERAFGYYMNQTLRTDVADRAHPITQGLASWEMVDETYTVNEPGEGSHILLTTDHPNSMKTLAWVRHYKKARVFCYQSGHDKQTFSDPNFRTVVGRGIQWLAARI